MNPGHPKYEAGVLNFRVIRYVTLLIKISLMMTFRQSMDLKLVAFVCLFDDTFLR